MLMRISSLVLLACAALAAGCTVGAPPAPAPPPPATSPHTVLGATESRIFEFVNAERARQGLPALVYNTQLDRMAKIQAANMARLQKMAHVLPGASLPTLGDRARFVGYPFGRISENLALNYPGAESVVRGWMRSPAHRQNILDRDVAETGIAIARSATGDVYYCQVFGRALQYL